MNNDDHSAGTVEPTPEILMGIRTLLYWGLAE